MKRKIIVEIDVDSAMERSATVNETVDHLLAHIAEEIDIALYRFFETEDPFKVRLEEI